MQTITMLESQLDEARRACEAMQNHLHRRFFASLVLPGYFDYFENQLEGMLELLDELLGFIAISQTPLRRTEMLGQTLLKDGLRSPTVSLFQLSSGQGAVASELSNIWNGDVERMFEIESDLLEYNQSLRDMRRAREHSDVRWLMDWLGFPTAESLPQTLNPRLMKDLFDTGAQSLSGHTIIEVPAKRLVRHN